MNSEPALEGLGNTRSVRVEKQPVVNFVSMATVMNYIEGYTYDKAIQKSKLQQPMKAAMASIHQNQTWGIRHKL